MAKKERCEWDPDRKQAALFDNSGCPNDAAWSIGARGNWHVCASCARLPRFAGRYKVFKPCPPLKCPLCSDGRLNKLDEEAQEDYYLACDICEFAVAMTEENATALKEAAKFVQTEVTLDKETPR